MLLRANLTMPHRPSDGTLGSFHRVAAANQPPGTSVSTIQLSGAIDLQHSPKLRKLLQTSARLRTPILVLDFRNVEYIDSSGLATLVEYYKNARLYAGQLIITGLNERVRATFNLLRLGELFQIN